MAPVGATRNVTGRFENFRSAARASSSRRGSSDQYRPADALLTADDRDHDALETSVGLAHSLPPEWVDIVESIQGNVGDIKGKLKQLQTLHASKLKVSFDDSDAGHEHEIQILTDDITRDFHLAQNSLKRIATVGNAKGTNLPTKERVVRLNVMRNLATEVSTLTKQFRHMQKDFVMRSEFFEEDHDSKDSLAMSHGLEHGFSAQDMAQLEIMEKSATEREQEIIKIAQSINDLASMFSELSVLVIEQGSIVDRIDYNVEQTLTKVKEGNKELKIADDYSKKARSVMCILILLVICIILIAILAWKHSK